MVEYITYINRTCFWFDIPGRDRRILTIDKKLIQLRLGQSNGEETQPIHHNVVDDIVGCTVFDVGVWNDAVYMGVGMAEKVVIMKYNPELRKFCTRKVISLLKLILFKGTFA